MPGNHWAVFYAAYRDWYKGELCPENEAQLFRILRTIRECVSFFRHADNVDAQYVMCSCWHEIQREKCIQEIWNVPER